VHQFSAGSVEDVTEIQRQARPIKTDIKLHAIPFGIQIEKGLDAIVEHLLEQVP
jgi:hypothetical protein